MPSSSNVTAGTDILATQYNNLRTDVLSGASGHTHDGTDGKTLVLNTAIPAVTATPTEINQALDGISANVTFGNLNTLTAGETSNADALHLHKIIKMMEEDFDAGYITVIGNANDGSTTSLATGTVTRDYAYSRFDTGASSGNGCVLRIGSTGSLGSDGNLSNQSYSVQWADDVELLFRAFFGAATSQDVFMGFYAGDLTEANLPVNSAMTTRHIAFIIDDGILYASVADGATQNKSDISSGVTLTSSNTYRIVWNGTSALFYVNGTLKATLATNVPTGTSDYPQLNFGIQTATGARRFMFVANNYAMRIEAPV